MLSVMHIIRLMGLVTCDNEIKAVRENNLITIQRAYPLDPGDSWDALFFVTFPLRCGMILCSALLGDHQNQSESFYQEATRKSYEDTCT